MKVTVEIPLTFELEVTEEASTELVANRVFDLKNLVECTLRPIVDDRRPLMRLGKMRWNYNCTRTE